MGKLLEATNDNQLADTGSVSFWFIYARRGHRSRGRMIVEFIAICTIRAYHH